jgi:hypothetical protein
MLFAERMEGHWMGIKFAIVGSGWRAEFFLRIAEALPELFRVTDVVARNPDKAEAIARRWGVVVHPDVDSLPDHGYDFAVVSVSRPAAPGILLSLTERGVPVLCETPPAPDLDALAKLHNALPRNAKVQVAEQYLFQPFHAARLQIAHSGKLGTVTQAQISAAHDYHGISLIRHFLNVGFEEAEVQSSSFVSPIIKSPGRAGPPDREELVSSEQIIAQLHYEGKLGVYDFTGDQYFSWIRTPRVLVRGERGEINNLQVSRLLDYHTPVETELKRTHAGHAGNLEGFYLKGIHLGEEEVYRNPFIPGRLSDDEIAIATCLNKMGNYVQGGPAFYSLAEASQDFYLGLLVRESARSGRPVRAVKQVWACP